MLLSTMTTINPDQHKSNTEENCLVLVKNDMIRQTHIRAGTIEDATQQVIEGRRANVDVEELRWPSAEYLPTYLILWQQ